MHKQMLCHVARMILLAVATMLIIFALLYALRAPNLLATVSWNG